MKVTLRLKNVVEVKVFEAHGQPLTPGYVGYSASVAAEE